MKTLETLPLAQFREAGFNDGLATPVCGTRGRLIQDLRHRLFQFLTGVALQRAAVLGIGTALAQRTIIASGAAIEPIAVMEVIQMPLLID
ncbi:MAG TPA: hypothetical protein VMF50_07185 [Candidatus Binataceae bacterium]|nr:hypothetical protein [Candidatus Binataceae bacterium]